LLSSTCSKNNLKELIRFWLIDHPELNPYKFSVKKFYQKLTSPLRSFPHFIIIGVGRAGTTALYSYLIQHPSIQGTISSNHKNAYDLHFFDFMISQSTVWYKSHFPIILPRFLHKKNLHLTGEYTSTYFYHPEVPKRIHKLLPGIKLIVILRNPIDKIYSTYYQQFRYGEISTSFEDTIDAEFKRMKILNNNSNFSSENPNIENFIPGNIIKHGIYADYFENWLNFFNQSQLLILDSYELKNNTNSALETVFGFLGLQNSPIEDLSHVAERKYPKLKESTRQKLIEFYKPHNKRLNELLKTNFDWDK
tara:strand:- start:1976 stop:2896 length:921 start_codon:yes stop_codon:yes gene_type:complete